MSLIAGGGGAAQQPGAHALAHQLDAEVDVPLLVSHPKAALLPVLQQLHGWNNAVEGDITVEQLSGAMTNMTYRCGLQARGREVQAVLMRVHASANTLFDRAAEIDTFQAVSAAGLGPRLLLLFDNGRVEEFLTHHVTLAAPDLRDPAVSAAIATTLATFHTRMSKVLAGSRHHRGLVQLWDRLRQWSELVQQLAGLQELQALGMSDLDRHISALEQQLSCQHPCWVALCHNDLQYGNIMAAAGAATDEGHHAGGGSSSSTHHDADGAAAAGGLAQQLSTLGLGQHNRAQLASPSKGGDSDDAGSLSNVSVAGSAAPSMSGLSALSIPVGTPSGKDAGGGSLHLTGHSPTSSVQLPDGSLVLPGMKSRPRGQSPEPARGKRPDGGGSFTSGAAGGDGRPRSGGSTSTATSKLAAPPGANSSDPRAAALAAASAAASRGDGGAALAVMMQAPSAAAVRRHAADRDDGGGAGMLLALGRDDAEAAADASLKQRRGGRRAAASSSGSDGSSSDSSTGSPPSLMMPQRFGGGGASKSKAPLPKPSSASGQRSSGGPPSAAGSTGSSSAASSRIAAAVARERSSAQRGPALGLTGTILLDPDSARNKTMRKYQEQRKARMKPGAGYEFPSLAFSDGGSSSSGGEEAGGGRRRGGGRRAGAGGSSSSSGLSDDDGAARRSSRSRSGRPSSSTAAAAAAPAARSNPGAGGSSSTSSRRPPAGPPSPAPRAAAAASAAAAHPSAGDGVLTLIDYEYAGFNPVAFDIANHWCEWAADYHAGDPAVLDFARLPDEAAQRAFVEAYLHCLLARLGVRLPADAGGDAAAAAHAGSGSRGAAAAASTAARLQPDGGARGRSEAAWSAVSSRGGSVLSMPDTEAAWETASQSSVLTARSGRAGAGAPGDVISELDDDELDDGRGSSEGGGSLRGAEAKPCTAQLRDVWYWLELATQGGGASSTALDGAAWRRLVTGLVAAARAYMAASHLQWALWGVIQAHTSDIDFDFSGYAKQRWVQYLAHREKLQRL